MNSQLEQRPLIDEAHLGFTFPAETAIAYVEQLIKQHQLLPDYTERRILYVTAMYPGRLTTPFVLKAYNQHFGTKFGKINKVLCNNCLSLFAKRIPEFKKVQHGRYQLVKPYDKTSITAAAQA